MKINNKPYRNPVISNFFFIEIKIIAHLLETGQGSDSEKKSNLDYTDALAVLRRSV